MAKFTPIQPDIFLNKEKTHAKHSSGLEFRVGDTVGHDGNVRGTEDETAYILHMDFCPDDPNEIMATTTKGTALLAFLYHPDVPVCEDDSVKCSESSESDSEDSVGSDEGLIRKLLAVVEAVDYDIYKGNYVEETAECSPEEVQEKINELVRIFKEA